MKKANKLFSVVLAIVLVLAMAIPAFAADTGSITISNAAAEQTYTVYQMLTFTPANTDGTQGIYKAASNEWSAFITGEGASYFNVASDGAVTLKEGADLAALAKAAIAYAKVADNGITATSSATAGKADEDGKVADVVIDNLALGYYAVDTSLGTVCALTNTNSDETLIEKNTEPTITKEVQEDSTDAWGAWNDADIGDTVNFKTTVYAKANSTKYVVHDTMDAGLTFNVDSIYIDGLDLTADYTVSTTCADGCTFEITLTEDYLATLTADTEIVITYSAVLNENAKIVTETNNNTTWLTYGDNQTKTEDSITKTLTYYFDLTKTDGTKQLDGAEFKLTNSEGKVMTFVAVEGGYRVATEEEIADEDVITTSTIVAGKVTIKGLDADTYSLQETKAPEGYNLLNEATKVEVTAATVGETVTFAPDSVTVVNKTGDLLPETGGIGTTIFYIVGALLVVGAVILLITKKRMSAEA